MAITLLIIGLAIFLGSHSLRIVAPAWRERHVANLGEARWKGLFSVVSLAGLALAVWGYGLARSEPVVLWLAPVWTRHLASLLTLPVFILIAAAYVPGNRIKAAIGHPMVVGVKAWALAHLLANGTLADLLLFGSFLLWAGASFAVSRRRDRQNGLVYSRGPASRTVMTGAAGLVVWFVFARFLHLPLIGVSPFGATG